MIRVDKFTISRRPYAIKRDTYRSTVVEQAHGDYARAAVDAVWFRRKAGVTQACIGHLWDYQSPPPADLEEFLARWDGRYGGDCKGRWDGTGYYSHNPDDAVRERHMAILRPMLDAYPAIPDGYDGWWMQERISDAGVS